MRCATPLRIPQAALERELVSARVSHLETRWLVR
jgi:hypothetical protein